MDLSALGYDAVSISICCNMCLLCFLVFFFPLPCSIDQPQGNLSRSLTAFWFPDFLLGFLCNELCLLKLYSSLFKAEFFFCKNHIITNSTSVTVGVYL